MNKYLLALTLVGALPSTAAAVQEIQYNTTDPQELKDLKDTVQVSESFLESLDSGNYNGSWERASRNFQSTIPEGEWNSAMGKIRKPLGQVVHREIADQRVAKNPARLPPGDYMVLFYRSSFSNKANAYELVTLVKEDGQWKVLTYQVQ